MSQLEFVIRKALRFPPKLVKQTTRRIKRFYMTKIVRDEFTIEVRRWFKDNGDETLRLDYDLSADSIVFDLGGYTGDFAEMMAQLYDCYVYVFEPSREFHEACVARFSGNPKIKCFNFGLSNADGQFVLSQADDGSSIKRGEPQQRGTLVDIKRFADVFAELAIDRIDLIKINIEGSEYDVLPHVIETGIIGNINHIQVQFHDFIKGAKTMRANIVRSLEKTHRRDWCYTFVWESWSLKP